MIFPGEPNSPIYARRLRQVAVIWGVATLVLIGLYRLQLQIPALAEMLRPIYVIVVALAAFVSWRWLRSRSRGDRRARDRRGAPPEA